MNSGAAPRPLATQAGVHPLAPRLVGVKDAASYLGISATEIRELIARGQLTAVRPNVGGRPLRRVLLAVAQLAALADSWAPA